MSLGSEMTVPKPILHIPYAYVMAVTFSLPVSALFSCVFLAYVLHFEGATSTHCKVPNFIPSISAVIGGHTPERYIWRLLMAFFSFPRIFDGFLYYNFFSLSLANHMTWYRWLNRIVWILHMWQYVSLFQLSYISSKENFILHRNGFIAFVACSVFHMMAFLLLFRAGRKPLTRKDRLSLRVRGVCTIIHYLSFFISIYVYWRHNTYCEPYMYSWYSLCEYIVVLSNIAFHSAAFLDFGGSDYYISIAPPSRLKCH